MSPTQRCNSLRAELPLLRRRCMFTAAAVTTARCPATCWTIANCCFLSGAAAFLLVAAATSPSQPLRQQLPPSPETAHEGLPLVKLSPPETCCLASSLPLLFPPSLEGVGASLNETIQPIELPNVTAWPVWKNAQAALIASCSTS